MAIAQMSKIMIVSHRDESAELLEALQDAGKVQILDAERALVTKEWPELSVAAERSRDIEELLANLSQSIEFLGKYKTGKDVTSALRPLYVVDQEKFNTTIKDKSVYELLDAAIDTETKIEETKDQLENVYGKLNVLKPWKSLSTPVEELAMLETSTVFTGLLANQHFEDTVEKAISHGAIFEQVSEKDGVRACLFVCMNEIANDVQKVLRAGDFDSISFDGMKGEVSEIIEQTSNKAQELESTLSELEEKARLLAERRVDLQILFDNTNNQLNRENTRKSVPATSHAVLMEGWVRKKDYKSVEKVVAKFPASCVSEVEPGEDEEVPVEIQNNRTVKPFEVITRLYGMPQYFEVDPTALLAPFFALFFALCLTDAGYGLIIIGFAVWMIRKMQGDKKLMWLLLVSSVLTLGAGALTGGWFGDGAQQLASIFGWDWLANARESLMWFDPLEKPMTFFVLAIGLGYLHIMVGLFTAFVHNLFRKDIVAAICDQLTWLVMLNSIVIFLFGSKLGIPASVSGVFGKVALLPAAMILLFSQREGPIAGRLGMGAYNLFSTIFYMGDVLSYLRLMALGMVTGGLAMAINVMAKTASEVPVVGKWVLVPVVLIGGHLFNTAISGLSAFVHTIRLQFVEFFPKFLVGGGTLFEPFSKKYKHVFVQKKEK